MSSPGLEAPRNEPEDSHKQNFSQSGSRNSQNWRGGDSRQRRRGFNNRFNQRDRRPFNQSDSRSNHEFHEDFETQKEARAQEKFFDKLAQLAGPSVDLPPVEISEKKFSGRNRLYIGNIASEVTESDLEELFKKCGEFGELFLNKDKSFAFVKFDYYVTCEKAKRELDGFLLKGKNLKIRFAPNNAAVKVKNLPSYVSNELLYYAFSVFGEIERASVCVDERGKPTGEGIVEYIRKGYALHAIRRCSERCFFLTESLRPVIVELYEYSTDSDGYPEKYLPKRNPDYLRARSKGPRLSELNSFEHDYGLRWKQLLDLYHQKELALKQELQMEMEKLEAQMEYARSEHETEMLRKALQQRELDRERQKQEWEAKERQVEEHRRRNEEQIRRQAETLQAQMMHHDEEMRRRHQENNLFVQAHQLNSILNEQEQNFVKPELNLSIDGNYNSQNEIHQQGSNTFRRDRWIHNRRDDFAPKRRRF